jgi:hypothetical protein
MVTYKMTEILADDQLRKDSIQSIFKLIRDPPANNNENIKAIIASFQAQFDDINKKINEKYAEIIAAVQAQQLAELDAATTRAVAAEAASARSGENIAAANARVDAAEAALAQTNASAAEGLASAHARVAALEAGLAEAKATASQGLATAEARAAAAEAKLATASETTREAVEKVKHEASEEFEAKLATIQESSATVAKLSVESNIRNKELEDNLAKAQADLAKCLELEEGRNAATSALNVDDFAGIRGTVPTGVRSSNELGGEDAEEQRLNALKAELAVAEAKAEAAEAAKAAAEMGGMGEEDKQSKLVAANEERMKVEALNKKIAAATKIQALRRGIQPRVELNRSRKAATSIQALRRGFDSRARTRKAADEEAMKAAAAKTADEVRRAAEAKAVADTKQPKTIAAPVASLTDAPGLTVKRQPFNARCKANLKEFNSKNKTTYTEEDIPDQDPSNDPFFINNCKKSGSIKPTGGTRRKKKLKKNKTKKYK